MTAKIKTTIDRLTRALLFIVDTSFVFSRFLKGADKRYINLPKHPVECLVDLKTSVFSLLFKGWSPSAVHRRVAVHNTALDLRADGIFYKNTYGIY